MITQHPGSLYILGSFCKGFTSSDLNVDPNEAQRAEV